MRDVSAVIFYGLLMAGVIVVGLYFFCWASLLLHEAGHFLAARAADTKVESVQLGNGPRWMAFDSGGVRWEVHAWPTSGSVNIEEGVFAYSVRQLAMVVLGGPLATLLLATLLTLIFYPEFQAAYPQVWGRPASSPMLADFVRDLSVSETEAILRMAVACIPGTLVLSAWATLLGCLVPTRMQSGIPTDGLQLWWLWFPEWRRKALLERLLKKPHGR